MEFVHIFMLLTIVLQSNGRRDKRNLRFRRFNNPGEQSVILGAPTYPYHLPPAEPILPGHTLVRPSIGMLKSAVKFPHREQENGSGVYGHFENLGIKYDGINERVLYTGFRRSSQNVDQIKSKKKSRQYADKMPGILILIRPRSYHTEVIAPQTFEGPEFFNFIQFASSNPQRSGDQDTSLELLETKAEPIRPKKYVPGKADGEFSIPQTDPIGGEFGNKTAMFWQTKGAFNHIKISPDAPDFKDLLPPEATTVKMRDWWFYHQLDFEEFADK